MKKILAILMITFTLVLTACGNSAAPGEAEADQDKEQDLTKIRIAIMTGGASHWYAVIGDETGIFEKHGIDIEITEFAAGINTVDAVVSGQADFGNLADYACVNRLGNTQDSTNLVIIDRISTSKGTNNGGLYVSDDIKTPEDLAGKGFAAQPGTVWDYWVAKTYEYAGIAKDDQNILNTDSAASAVALMISGNASAFWASGTNAAKLEEAGFHKLMSLDDLELYTDAYFIATSDYVNQNEEVVKNFVTAQHEIAEWIYANEDEAAAIFEKAAGTAQEQFHSDLAATQLVTDFTQETLGHLNNIKDWAVGNGSFADYDIIDFADFTALKTVYPDSVTLN